MPTRLLELGATRLLELGATQLLELGTTRQAWMGDTPSPVPSVIHSIYDMVNAFEDPLAFTGINDDELTPGALAIVNKIRNVNRRVRYSLGSSVGLGDIAGYDDLTSLGYQLNGLYLGMNFFSRVGKNLKRIHQTVAHKIIGVVKSPAFLSVAAIVVNVIPAVGQVASFALAAAATSRKLYAQKIDAAKAKKATKEIVKQVSAYNLETEKYYQAANTTIPTGQMLNKNGELTDDPHKMPGITFPISIAGKVYESDPGKPPKPAPKPKPVKPPKPPKESHQVVTQTAALPVAMALSNGQGVSGASELLHSYPASTQQEIAADVAEMQRFVSDPSFKPTSIKAIGQFVAMAEFDRGAGTGIMSEEQLALADAVKAHATPEILKAIEAGRQGLITSAALDGPDAVQAVKDAVSKGSSTGMSLTTIGLIGAGLAALGGIGYFVASRR